MHKRIIPLVLLMMFVCSKAYIKQGVLDPSFDKARTYKVAILPFFVRGELDEPGSVLEDRAYTRFQVRLQETGKFLVIDKFTVERATKVHEFGAQGSIDLTLVRKIAKELGAELVALTELSLNPAGGLRILVNIQIFDVNKDCVIYTGQGRADNPISTEAGVEFAIDLATDILVKKLK